jgi:hypothetical protein
MISFFLAIQLMSSERPVIRLDELRIEGQIKRPGITEIESSKLERDIEEIAFSSLIRLEKELLKPASITKPQQNKDH